MYSIIISTYFPHFYRVKKFIESCNKFVQDIDKLNIICVTSSNKECLELIDYLDDVKWNIKIVSIDNIIKSLFNVDISGDELYRRLYDNISQGKWSFQAVKKLLGLYYSENRFNLVVDSESLFIRQCKIEDIFTNFFEKEKYYFYTNNDDNAEYPKMSYATLMENCNIILRTNYKPYYFWEVGNWFFDKNILNDMKDHIEKINNKSLLDVLLQIKPIFEFPLYEWFIYHFNEKYNYNFICVNEEIKKYLKNNTFYDKQRERLWDRRIGFENTLNIVDNEWMKNCFRDLFTKFNISILMFGIPNLSYTSYHTELIEETECIKMLGTIDSIKGLTTQNRRFEKLDLTIN